MKKQVFYIIVAILVLILAIFAYSLANQPVMPSVGAGGEIKGDYSIASILRLRQPYKCTFQTSESDSKISGTLLTNGESVYGEFRILTSLVKDEFTSFLIIKDNKSYVWTSLYDFGYQTGVADSAVRNATPQEQGQIIGLRDKLPLACTPWEGSDATTFDPPSWINFSKL